MKGKDKLTVPSKDTKGKGKFSDEKTGLKIHKHLSDEHDQISEQDIKNVRTDFSSETDEAALQNEETGNDKKVKEGAGVKPAEDVTKEIKDTAKEEEGIPITTPWNILGS